MFLNLTSASSERFLHANCVGRALVEARGFSFSDLPPITWHESRRWECEVEKREVVKGYEYSRGQFLTFTAEELKALDVESSKVVDLERFVAGDDIDPVYFDSPYFVYPDGPIAVEVL